MKLLLFDIDGTLLKCHGQAGRAFIAALEEVFGTAGDLAGTSFAGRTDSSIVYDLLLAVGLERQEIDARLPAMKEAYLRRVQDGGLDRAGMELLPGVVELLDRLSARDDVALGLLTGNWHGGARAKLACFDLERYFPFGAFGDDGIERHELPPVALARAADHHGRRFAVEDTLLVGDTPRDVHCGRVHGIGTVAVATGTASREELQAAGAAWVLSSLAALDVDRLLAVAAPTSG